MNAKANASTSFGSNNTLLEVVFEKVIIPAELTGAEIDSSFDIIKIRQEAKLKYFAIGTEKETKLIKNPF